MRAVTLSNLTSTLIVAAFAAIGLNSHVGQNADFDLSSVIDGSTQSIYEDGFKSANPMKPFAIPAMGTLKYVLFGQAAPGAIIGKNGWVFTAEELSATPVFNMNIEASARRIAGIHQDLADRDIVLLPVIVPDKAEIYEDQLGLVRPDRIKARKTILLRHLDEAGVEYLDASGALQRTKTHGEVFLRDDTHWSPAGSRAVAMDAASRLTGMNIAAADVKTVSKGHAPFDGDLLAFIPTGALRGFIGPTQRFIERYETSVQTNAGLLGDAPTDVALVGTSFSAKSDWHFEGFLKHALQADLVNFAQEGRGPFAPMDAFLASEFFNTTPPKVVIWEIPARYISKDQ